MKPWRALCVGLAFALSACGWTTTHVAPTSYTVSAIVEAYPDGTAGACYFMYFTFPGDCASPLPISHVVNPRSPYSLGNDFPFGAAALTRGAYLTPRMTLTGTWTGSSLALTSPPTRASASASITSGQLKVWSATKLPSVAQMNAGLPTAAGLQDQQVLMRDIHDLQHRGIFVMETGFDEAGLYILVAAADPASVGLLRSRYNVQTIYGWLHPVP